MVTLRFVNTTVFSIDVTLDALLTTMIGGVGTLLGAVSGAGIIEYLQHYLSELASTYPIFDRWTILLGLLYIFVVLGFPSGLPGLFKKVSMRRGEKKKSRAKNREGLEKPT